MRLFLKKCWMHLCWKVIESGGCAPPILVHRFYFFTIVVFCALIFPARAQIINPAQQPIGIQSYALGPGTIAIGSGGGGYATNDTITLACAGTTFTTSPIIAVTAQAAGVVTGSSVIQPGVTTSPSANACTFTQASTSGSGSGATFTGNFAPIAAVLSVPTLTTGGTANGNLFIGGLTPLASLGTAENTFVGTLAGGKFSGAAASNTAFGLDACGTGGSTPTGSFNACLGRNAGRNISGAAARNTLVGDSAAGNEIPNNLSGSDNTVVGSGGQALTSGNLNVFVGNLAGGANSTATGSVLIGYAAGQNLTNGFATYVGFEAGLNSTANNTAIGASAGSSIINGGGNVILGNSVASTTLTSGNNNIVIGSGASCDTAGASDSNTITICGGAGAIIHSTGDATPATSITTVTGTLSVAALANSATTSSVCYNTATGALTYDGTIGTCNTSSIRFKHDIQSLIKSEPDPLSAVMRMQPISFYYNDDMHTSGEQISLLAENLAAIDPRLVSYDNEGKPRSLRIFAIIGYLTAAIQQQQKQIDNYRHRVQLDIPD